MARPVRAAGVVYKDLDVAISAMVIFEKGDCCLRHFSVVESGCHDFHLTYDERNTCLPISKFWRNSRHRTAF